MFSLNLHDDQNQLLVPSFPVSDRKELGVRFSHLGITNHFLLSSSGTSGGDWKGYLISKESLFTNAKAVNDKLELTSNDIWGASLPFYHIGGLSIYFRAKLLNHQPVDLRPWVPEQLVQKIRDHKVSVLSLVPTQIYDLVKLGLEAPKCLRFILVGGDFLSQELARRFIKLGWPVLRTFGMSEVSSQLCTGMDEKGFYSPLPIHEIRSDGLNNLFVKSQSFFSYVVQKNAGWELTPLQKLLDPEGFFKLADKGIASDEGVKFLGRDDGQIKSSGHLLNLIDLKERLDLFCLAHNCWGMMELQNTSSEREGQSLTIHYLESLPKKTVQRFLDEIHPIRIGGLQSHIFFKRTALGKFKTQQT